MAKINVAQLAVYAKHVTLIFNFKIFHYVLTLINKLAFVFKCTVHVSSDYGIKTLPQDEVF